LTPPDWVERRMLLLRNILSRTTIIEIGGP
jgi:hypothetical protein